MSDNDLFNNPIASLRLRRWPRHRHERLQAWDGADLLLLEELARTPVTACWVFNDTCGALALPLLAQGCQLLAVTDSWVARQALQANAHDNGIGDDRLHCCWQLEQAPFAPQRVLMRAPKNLNLLEAQLAAIACQLTAPITVTVTAMDKHAPATLMTLLEKWIGPARRDRGARKAHLYHAESTQACTRAVPTATAVAVPALGASLWSEPGVFSQERLDPGASFFLGHLPVPDGTKVADLGCGNGVLGLAMAMADPALQVWLCDESAAAVRSARKNVEHLGLAARCHVHHGNGLDGLDEQFDTVVLNPPFHRGHAIDTRVAEMLFDHARRQLRQGGCLRVIGNRHLEYAPVLRKKFTSVVQIAADPRFTIWEAQKA